MIAQKGITMRMLTIRSLFFVLAILGLFAATLGVVPPARAQIGISVSFGPPELPVYEQPICPSEGYLWVPGYWAYGDDDYYWVPGTWVEAPEVGYLWTPGYWGWRDNGYYFNDGYRRSASTAASIMASATTATATKAGAGTMDAFSTIAR